MNNINVVHHGSKIFYGSRISIKTSIRIIQTIGHMRICYMDKIVIVFSAGNNLNSISCNIAYTSTGRDLQIV